MHRFYQGFIAVIIVQVPLLFIYEHFGFIRGTLTTMDAVAEEPPVFLGGQPYFLSNPQEQLMCTGMPPAPKRRDALNATSTAVAKKGDSGALKFTVESHTMSYMIPLSVTAGLGYAFALLYYTLAPSPDDEPGA